MSVDPITSKKQMPSDDVPKQLLVLLAELIRSEELPELAIGGAWFRISQLFVGHPGLGPKAVDIGLFDLVAEHLRALGNSSVAVSISCATPGRAYAAVSAAYNVLKAFAGHPTRPDVQACVASGVFDICIDMVAAFASRGMDGLQDTDHCALTHALNLCKVCSSEPGCEAKLRSVATALAFCLEHPLECIEEFGSSTGASAAQICESPPDVLWYGAVLTVY